MTAQETKLRSIAKAAAFRVIMTIVGSLIGFAFTGSFLTSLWIFLAHGAAAFILYFIHERVWIKIKWGIKFNK